MSPHGSMHPMPPFPGPYYSGAVAHRNGTIDVPYNGRIRTLMDWELDAPAAVDVYFSLLYQFTHFGRANTDNVDKLFQGFLQFYGTDIDLDRNGVSCRVGGVCPRICWPVARSGTR